MGILDIAGAVVKGIASVPMDIYYGGRRTAEDVGLYGSRIKAENAEERERILKLIRWAIDNPRVFQRMITIIFSDFMEKVPESLMGKIEAKMQLAGLKYASRKGAQFALVTFLGMKIADKLFVRVIAQRAAKFGIGFTVSAVLLQGTLERASNASRRLRVSSPALWKKLSDANLDMLYFLVEDEMGPFVAFIGLSRRDPQSFDRAVEQLDAILR